MTNQNVPAFMLPPSRSKDVPSKNVPAFLQTINAGEYLNTLVSDPEFCRQLPNQIITYLRNDKQAHDQLCRRHFRDFWTYITNNAISEVGRMYLDFEELPYKSLYTQLVKLDRFDVLEVCYMAVAEERSRLVREGATALGAMSHLLGTEG